MSGHSKWSTIKRKKGVADARRGKLFTKLIREITIAAREGGGDPATNPSLRLAIDTAKSNSMPKDNIERAIKKGTGEGGGAKLEASTYEGYGPAGVAILVNVLTENKNRTISAVRHIFDDHEGNLGAAGCVNWMFNKNGLITIDKKEISEEKLMDIVIAASADDLKEEDDGFEVITAPENFLKVKDELVKQNIKFTSAEVTMIPKNTVKVTGKVAEKVLKLVEALEDNDDVQNVYANFDIDEDELEKMG